MKPAAVFLALLCIALPFSQCTTSPAGTLDTQGVVILVTAELTPADAPSTPPLYLTFLTTTDGVVDPIIQLTPVPGSLDNPGDTYFITSGLTPEIDDYHIKRIAFSYWDGRSKFNPDELAADVNRVFEITSSPEFLGHMPRIRTITDLSSRRLRPNKRIPLTGLDAVTAEVRVTLVRDR